MNNCMGYFLHSFAPPVRGSVNGRNIFVRSCRRCGAKLVGKLDENGEIRFRTWPDDKNLSELISKRDISSAVTAAEHLSRTVSQSNPYFSQNLPRKPMEAKIEITTVTYVTAPGIGARVDVSTLNADQIARGVEEIRSQIDRLVKASANTNIKAIRTRIAELEDGLSALVKAANAAFDAKNASEEPERAGGTD